MPRFLIVFLCAALFVTIPFGSRPRADAAPPSTPDHWAWLEGTDGYVPQQNLAAVETDLETLEVTAVSDQTVFHIDRYSNGSFWGLTAVQITQDPPRPRCLAMVGSVTPDGSLQLTFTPILPDVPPELLPKTTGIGRMRLQHGQWKMELQMTAGIDLTKLLTHWAFMTQCPA